MDDWQTMFEGVQLIARSATSIEEGVQRTLAFARTHPSTFDDLDYWNRMEHHAAKLPADVVIDWAREGLEELNRGDGWDFLLLDLGDCPEIFEPYRLWHKPPFHEQIFRDLCLSHTIIGFDQLIGGVTPDHPSDGTASYERHQLTYHNVTELNDEIRTWNNDSTDYNGNNGYLLWLAFGSLALLEPLRDNDYCNKILMGRQRLYLLSGFEEIFLYLTTVTSDGLRFEHSHRRA